MLACLHTFLSDMVNLYSITCLCSLMITVHSSNQHSLLVFVFNHINSSDDVCDIEEPFQGISVGQSRNFRLTYVAAATARTTKGVTIKQFCHRTMPGKDCLH